VLSVEDDEGGLAFMIVSTAPVEPEAKPEGSLLQTARLPGVMTTMLLDASIGPKFGPGLGGGGVDTPEMNHPDTALRALAVKAKGYTPMDRADKYGRWLAVIHIRDSAGIWLDLNAELLRLGIAREAPWR